MNGGFDGYIGMFDSGVGGISVLKRAVELLPHESFLFYGDSANAPYGEKSVEWVRERSSRIVEGLLERGVKAIVIACNTATGAAAETLRERYPDVPLIGVEPALKPAVNFSEGERVLVMATPITLGQGKFQRLYEEWGPGAQVSTVACTGLAMRIERGNLNAPDMLELLESLIGEHRGVHSVVLGCTHYPFVRQQIRSVLGDVTFFDGGDGAARQLVRLLEEESLLADSQDFGDLRFCSSKNTPEELALYRRFFDFPLD